MDFDRELIVRAKRGDVEAQEALVIQFAPMVFRLVGRFFRTREDVEDLSQDVFLKLFDRLDQVRPQDNFPGWLARVTVNVCYDHLRKLRRRKIGFENLGPLADSTPPPQIDSFGHVRAALGALDPKLRVPLILKEVEEMTVGEIARSMGLTQTNIKVRLFRARKKLAKMLENNSQGSINEEPK